MPRFAANCSMLFTEAPFLERFARARAAGFAAVECWWPASVDLDAFAAVGAPNLKYQYDVYHLQRMEGNLVETLTANIGRIAHVQVADVPERNQPGTGEINYRRVLATLDDLGYDGYVALEYRPRGSTEESLAWLPPDRSGAVAAGQL